MKCKIYTPHKIGNVDVIAARERLNVFSEYPDFLNALRTSLINQTK